MIDFDYPLALWFTPLALSPLFRLPLSLIHI